MNSLDRRTPSAARAPAPPPSPAGACGPSRELLERVLAGLQALPEAPEQHASALEQIPTQSQPVWEGEQR